MPTSPLLAGLLLAAALLPIRAADAQRSDQDHRRSTEPAPPAPGPQPEPERSDAAEPPRLLPGHLVLVVEGTVQQLAVRHALAKPAPWGGVSKGLESPFAVLAFDGQGRELLRVPLDLSRFETDPEKVGQPVRVEGCEVKSSAICVLLNLPRLRDATLYRIVRREPGAGDRPAEAQLGAISAAALQRMIDADGQGGGK